MSPLVKVLLGGLVGGVGGILIGRLFARPILQSLAALSVGWTLGSVVPALAWFFLASGPRDVRALSAGLSAFLLGVLTVAVAATVVHLALGWAGSAVHAGFTQYRPVIIGVLGGLSGALSITLPTTTPVA